MTNKISKKITQIIVVVLLLVVVVLIENFAKPDVKTNSQIEAETDTETESDFEFIDMELLENIPTDLPKEEIPGLSIKETGERSIDYNIFTKVFEDGDREYILEGNKILKTSIVVEEPEKLEYVGIGYFKDTKHVYSDYLYESRVNNGVVDGVEPNRFYVVGTPFYLDLTSWHYTKENGLVYYIHSFGYEQEFTKKLLDADADYFRILGGAYTMDNSHIFFQDKKVTDDIDNFEVIEIPYAGYSDKYTFYSKDGQNVYYAGDKLDGAKPDLFKAGRYVKFILGMDDELVFYGNTLLTGISPDKVKIESGAGMGYVISDEDTNWYFRGYCGSEPRIFSEEEFFQGEFSDWDKERYLDEYVYC